LKSNNNSSAARAVGLRRRESHMNPWVAVTCGLVCAVAAQTVAAQVSRAEPERVTTGDTVVTATRFPQPRAESAVGVTVVTGEELIEAGVRSLPEALARMASFTVRDSTGSTDVQVDLRSFGSTGDQNTLVMVDGVRISENELTTARWSSIPLSAVDRVEILRSSGAVLYGGGATGGVVNVITRTLEAGERSAQLYGSYGSYNTSDLRARAAVAGERLGFSANIGRYYSDNYRDNNRVIDGTGQLALHLVGPGPRASLRVSGGEQNLRLPGPRTETELVTDRRGTSTPNDYAIRRDLRATLGAAVDIGAGELRIDGGYRSHEVDALSAFGAFSSTLATQSEVWSASPRLRLPFSIGALPNTLVAGVDWEDWNYDSARSFGPVSVVASQTNRAVYMQDSIDLPTGTLISIGGRLQEVEYASQDVLSTAPYASGTQTRRPKAYELAVRQRAGATWSLFGKIGRSFRIATLDEVYSQFGGPVFDSFVRFLEPQTSLDRELGVEYRAGASQGRASLYLLDLENEIRLDPVTFTNVNLPPTRRYGLEIEGATRPIPRLELAGNYTYAIAEFRSGTLGGVDVTGNEVPLAPRNKLNARVSFDFTERTRGTLLASWVDQQLFDGDERNDFGQRMPAFTVVDLLLAHRRGGWLISAGVKNLFNEKYFTYAVRSQFVPGRYNAYPQPERAVWVSAQYTF
jgi:iron complex outermembrane receptor protein